MKNEKQIRELFNEIDLERITLFTNDARLYMLDQALIMDKVIDLTTIRKLVKIVNLVADSLCNCILCGSRTAESCCGGCCDCRGKGWCEESSS